MVAEYAARGRLFPEDGIEINTIVADFSCTNLPIILVPVNFWLKVASQKGIRIWWIEFLWNA